MYIITGGGSGIGAALAQRLSQEKQSVLIIGRRQQPLEDTAGCSSTISYLCADISKADDRQRIVDIIQRRDEPIQGLIHNAGTIEPLQTLAEISESDWLHFFKINLHAPFFLTQSLLKELLHDKARVLHMGSGAAYFTEKGWGGYCISKAALAMLTRAWQTDMPELCITSVMPGIVDTAMTGAICDSTVGAPDKTEFFHQLRAEKRMITAQTVASFLRWLLIDVDTTRYVAKEWDIYDTTDHSEWMRGSDCAPPL